MKNHFVIILQLMVDTQDGHHTPHAASPAEAVLRHATDPALTHLQNMEVKIAIV